MSRARNLSKLGNINLLSADDVSTEVGIASTVPRSTLDVRGEIKVGTAIQAGTAGVLTATSFSGSGSNLTGLATTETVRADTLTVAGVSTFTGAVNVDATTDSTSTSTGALIVDGGVGIAKNVYIGAGLSVAGTLTYEDVTSVDSVGLITAKSGVNITGGQLTVGSGITMGIAGVATFSGTSDVHLLDNVKLNVGDSNDFQVSHDGSNTILNNTSGHLKILSDQTISFRDSGDNEAFAVFTDNGSVDLYYNNSKKFETTNDGTVTTGISTVDGLRLGDSEYISVGAGGTGDLQISHNGTDSIIKNTTGRLDIKSDSYLYLESDDRVYIGNVGQTKVYANFIVDGAVNLYHNNNAKFATTNDGTVTTGISTATDFFVNTVAAKGLKNTATGQRLIQQASNETRLYHASNAQVKLTFRGSGDTYRGAVNADANGMALLTGAASEEYGVLCVADGATNLYYDASKKFETTNDGVKITGIATCSNGLDTVGMLRESYNTVANKLSAAPNIDVYQGMVHYFTTTETTTATPNLRYTSTQALNDFMSAGDAITVTIITNAAAAGFSANWEIDGTGITEEWVGGSAPTAGGSDGYDIYTANVLKIGDADWKVFINLVNAT